MCKEHFAALFCIMEICYLIVCAIVIYAMQNGCDSSYDVLVLLLFRDTMVLCRFYLVRYPTYQDYPILEKCLLRLQHHFFAVHWDIYLLVGVCSIDNMLECVHVVFCMAVWFCSNCMVCCSCVCLCHCEGKKTSLIAFWVAFSHSLCSMLSKCI
jgi:hypothetical protein